MQNGLYHSSYPRCVVVSRLSGWCWAFLCHGGPAEREYERRQRLQKSYESVQSDLVRLDADRKPVDEGEQCRGATSCRLVSRSR